MRRFSSYGPLNTKLHYYAPRKNLIDRAYTQLIGENPSEGGHYITVWAPRQCGKTWIMQEIVEMIKQTDLRIFEAVYHFNLYSYLKQLLGAEGGNVFPEFPTGNGKIDLIINYEGKQYGLEVKSYTTRGNYRQSLGRAAQYGSQLGLDEIFLVFFVDAIDEENRSRYEKNYLDEATGVNVVPLFLETGE